MPFALHDYRPRSITLVCCNFARVEILPWAEIPPKTQSMFLSLLGEPPTQNGGWLSVGHPAWISVSAKQTRRHNVNCVTSAVRFACGWIHRHVERGIDGIPWFLPRSHTSFEHVDDAIGDFPPEIPFGRRGQRGDLHLIWIR